MTNFLSQPLDLQQLRLFHEQHRSVFERPLRLAVDVLRFGNLRDAEKARVAMSAGANVEYIRRADDGILAHLPPSPLPAHVLRRYLGPALTEVALTLEQGEVSELIRRSDGVYLIRATAVEPAELPEFDEVRAQVESEYRRRGREWALDQTLSQLWQSADIDFNLNLTDGLVPDRERARYLPHIFTPDTE